MIGDVPGGTVIRTEDSHAVDALLAAASVGPCALVIGGEPVRLWGVTGEGIAELQQ